MFILKASRYSSENPYYANEKKYIQMSPEGLLTKEEKPIINNLVALENDNKFFRQMSLLREGARWNINFL
jgi:hypothetical protein